MKKVMSTMFVLAMVMSAVALAQVRQGRWTPVVESMERGYSSISYWTNRDDGVEIGGGRISVEHGKPKWPAALDEQPAFNRATVGRLWRLGNNKWTTLDTQLPLRFANRKVEPGIYYLVLERPDSKTWNLAFVSPRSVSPGFIDAWAAQARPREVPILFSVSLRYARGSKTAELEMHLALEKDDMSKGLLHIQWGPHQLETTFDIDVTSATFYKTEDGT